MEKLVFILMVIFTYPAFSIELYDLNDYSFLQTKTNNNNLGVYYFYSVLSEKNIKRYQQLYAHKEKIESDGKYKLVFLPYYNKKQSPYILKLLLVAKELGLEQEALESIYTIKIKNLEDIYMYLIELYRKNRKDDEFVKYHNLKSYIKKIFESKKINDELMLSKKIQEQFNFPVSGVTIVNNKYKISDKTHENVYEFISVIRYLLEK